MAEQSTLARPYAQAAFAYAKENGKLQPWAEALVILAALVEQPKVQSAIYSPDLGRDRVFELMRDAVKDRIDDGLANLLKLLVENKRLPQLPGIAELFLQLKDEAENVVEAQMISAFEVSEQDKQKVVASLKKRLGRDVNLSCRVDNALIGGAVIRAGDLVIDSSMAAQLEQLSHQLGA